MQVEQGLSRSGNAQQAAEVPRDTSKTQTRVLQPRLKDLGLVLVAVESQ